MKTSKFFLSTLIAAAAMTATAYAETTSEYETISWGTHPTTMNNFYAGDYSLTFNFTDRLIKTLNTDKTYVLAAYWGSNAGDPDANALLLNYSTESQKWTLQLGRGELVGGGYGSAITANTTFELYESDYATFSTSIASGTSYTLSVVGGDQAMIPTLSWGDSDEDKEVKTSYKGNMNGGGTDTTMNCSLISAFYNLWDGGETGNWSDVSWNTGLETNHALVAGLDTMFDSSVTMTTTENVTLGSLSVAEGATLTLAGTGTVTVSGIDASSKVSIGADSTLAVTGANNAKVSAGGTGTLAFSDSVSNFTDSNNRGTLNISNNSDTDKFTGTVRLSGIQVDFTQGGSLGDATKVVLDNASLHFANMETTFAKNIEIESGKNGYIRSWGNNKFARDAGVTISGTVTGAGTLTSSDDGDVEFTNTVDIGKYVAGKSNGITKFSGATTLGALEIVSGATVTFGESATLTLTGVNASSVAVTDAASSGLFDGTATFALATGEGTLSGLSADKLTINESKASSVDLSAKTATATVKIYNIAENSTKNYSDIASDISSAYATNVLGTLDMGTTASATLNAYGNGTVKFDTTGQNDHSNISMNLGSNFQGTLEVKGSFASNSYSLGEDATIKLSGGPNYSIWGSNAATIANKINFASDYKIILGNNLTLTKEVTAAKDSKITICSGWPSAGNTLTLNNASFDKIDLQSGAKINVAGSVNISGASTIAGEISGTGKLTFSGGETTWSGTGSLGDGGDVIIAKEATLDASGENAQIFQTNFVNTGSLLIQGTLKVRNYNYEGTLGGFKTNPNMVTLDGGKLVFTNSFGATNDANGQSRATTVTANGGTIVVEDGVSVVLTGNSNAGAFETNGGSLTFDVGKNGSLLISEGSAGANEKKKISGSARVEKIGAGVLTLSDASSYTGGTTVSAGTLVAAHANALGDGNVSIGENGTLTLNHSTTINNLDNVGTIDFGDATTAKTLTLNVDTGVTSRSGYIKGFDTAESAESWAGVHHLVKTGEGTLSLVSGEDSSGNVCVASLTVEKGVVEMVSGWTHLGIDSYADVSVADGATLKVVVADDSVIEAGDVTFANGSKLVVDLTNVEVSGDSITLGIVASTAIEINGETLTSGSTYSLRNASAGTVDLPAEFVSIVGDSAFSEYINRTWSYDGSTLSLTLAIPEPSMFGLLAGLGALALVGTRRRTKKSV